MDSKKRLQAEIAQLTDVIFEEPPVAIGGKSNLGNRNQYWKCFIRRI